VSVAAVHAASISIFEAPLAPVIELAERRAPRLTDALSRRELEVLEGLTRGERTEEMALSLHLSTHTVRSHVKSALRKLGARTRAHAVAIAYREGALDLGG
jgi:DNA-binding CsgD family transcriptional regulator